MITDIRIMRKTDNGQFVLQIRRDDGPWEDVPLVDKDEIPLSYLTPHLTVKTAT